MSWNSVFLNGGLGTSPSVIGSRKPKEFLSDNFYFLQEKRANLLRVKGEDEKGKG